MNIELEEKDIEAIASKVADILKPLLHHAARKEEKDALLDVHQLAEYLNVSKSWIYDQIRSNELPHSKLGKYLRFRRRDIDKWIETKSFKPFPDLKVIKMK
jgi:excisionase family DNA binding protein